MKSEMVLHVWDAGEADYDNIPPRDWRDWGGWCLEGSYLFYPAYRGGDYSINLECRTSSAAVLDIIAQVAKKPWATNECVAGLVFALDDLLDVQANLCSCGADKRLTITELRQRLQGAALRQRKSRGKAT